MGLSKMKKKLLAFVFLLLMVVVLRWNAAPFFSAKEHRCVQIGSLSKDYFSSIKMRVGECLAQKYSAHALISDLKNKFSLLNKIVVAYRPLAICVTMYAHKPVCCINDDVILVTENQIVPKNCFTTTSLAQIPHITVAEEYMAHTASLVSLLCRLPSNFYEKYDLELVNEHYIRLIDKYERQFTIVSSTVQKNMSALLAQCASVKKNIGERKGFDKGVRWIADTRFADYIVTYKA
jgi:hypothetical protein